MLQNTTILQELKELNSTLIRETGTLNVYTVPSNYFEGLAANVLNRIKAMDAVTTTEELQFLSPLVNSIGNNVPYTIPANYFETFAENMLSVVHDQHVNVAEQTAREELETLSPFLSGVSKKMPNSVPAGYFENLTVTKNIQQPASKVVSMTGRKWFRYAAAAVVAGIIGTASILYINRNKSESEAGGKALADFTKDVKKMNAPQQDSLIEFIDGGVTNELAVITNPSNPHKPEDVKTLLQGISDDELKDFEKQTDDMEDVLMTN